MVARDRVEVGAAASAAEMLAADLDFTPEQEWDEFLKVGEYHPLHDSDGPESHDYERQIQRKLLDTPGLHFSSLVIRRLDHGICVQGVLETSGPHLDLARIVREISGVDLVLDQVVVRDCPTAAMEC